MHTNFKVGSWVEIRDTEVISRIENIEYDEGGYCFWVNNGWEPKENLKEVVVIRQTGSIKEDMLEATKVVFLQPIFEEDFPERGMKAWLTKIERCEDEECYKLYFDFTEFEEENDKYLTADYYDDHGTPNLTAKEAGYYTNKYSVYFGDLDKDFSEQIKEHLKIIE